ncbi:zygote arrest protein 2.L-like [Argopecten irradians]|uniref:zygote arrest protein 2.L-like n=1 Tax=Argopecten irradians TaxID=31199 RepID=UPI00371C3531
MPGQRHYGYFRCPSCNGHWESAQVFPVSNGANEYFKQDCKKCKIACSPYRVEPLQCPNCGQQAAFCCCPRSDQHHVDPNKAHRNELCHKCRSGYPCGN